MRKITGSEIESFRNYLVDEEKSSATIEKYLRDARTFAVWLEKREINKQAVLEYKTHLARNYAISSANSMLSSLNSFFACCEWHDLKTKIYKIQRQSFSSAEKELTKAEYERLLTTAQRTNNRRLYYLMQTLCSTGIRVSELQHITMTAVAEERAVIRCKGKLRIVLLPEGLCRMLSAYAKTCGIQDGAVFVSKNGTPLDRSHIWKMLKDLCESADVPKEKVFPHNFRHLFARTYYDAQKDVVRLADILGHSSINTTRIYTMETGEIHRKQIQSLGLLQY